VLTTLYGAVCANVVVAPLAARLHATATEKEMRMGLTVDWVMMLMCGDVAAAVAQRVGGPRPPAEIIRSFRNRRWASLSQLPQRLRA
jgi:flagellar motor component MotA